MTKRNHAMTESEMRELMEEIFYNTEEVEDVQKFEDLCMLTRNTGLVVDLEDGSQFQITIVKSR
jgi:hypothetical protein